MPKTAFLFPGQGAQTVGMGAALTGSLPAARRLFDEASEILTYNLLDVCTNGPKERLDATDVSQPAIFVASLAALESLKESEPSAADEVVATAGLSLGEYSALVFAGALTFREGLQVVRERGRAMQDAAEATPSGMVSVLGPEADAIVPLVEQARTAGTIEVANRLCPGNTVVSGTTAACNRLIELANEQGAKTVRLSVAGAFHTVLMKPADERLAAALNRVELKVPRIPVWSNVDAQPHTDPAEIKELLVRQVLEPVLWEASMRGLLATGVERYYEIGPGRVLTGLMKRIERKIDFRNVSA